MAFALEDLIRIGSPFAFIVVGLAYCVLKIKENPKRIDLAELIVVSIAGSALPVGLMFFYCAFNPNRINVLSDVGIYFSIAGVVLIYIAIATFIEKTKH